MGKKRKSHDKPENIVKCALDDTTTKKTKDFINSMSERYGVAIRAKAGPAKF